MICLLVLFVATQSPAADWTFGPPPMRGGRGPQPRVRSSATRTGSNDQGPSFPQFERSRPANYQEPVEAADELGDATEPELPEPILAPSGPETLPDGPETIPAPELPEMAIPVEDTMPVIMPEDVGLDDDGQPLCPPALTISSGRWFNRGCWYTQLEATYFSRFSGRKKFVLATDLSSPQTQDKLRIPSDLGFAPGARLTLGRFLGRDPINRDHSVEFTFMGLNNWSRQAGLQSQLGDGLETNVPPGGSIPGFSFTNLQQFTYSASFNSYEMNYKLSRRLGRDRLVLTRQGEWVRMAAPKMLPTLYGGLRILQLNENLQYLSEATDPSKAFGLYNVRTHNTMFGLQGGSNLAYQKEHWRFDCTTKAGAFVNWCDQATNLNSFDVKVSPPPPNQIPTANGFINRNYTTNRSTLAGMFELTLTGAYMFRPNMAFRSSYELLLVSGLAIADKQLTFANNNPPVLVSTGGMMLQGLTVGFEFNW